MTDVERFITAIRNTIEQQLRDQLGPDRYQRLADADWLNTDQLARAIHQTVITYQAPPF